MGTVLAVVVASIVGGLVGWFLGGWIRERMTKSKGEVDDNSSGG